MAATPLISEEDLHAFVDGETDAQTNAAVLAYLASSPADAARVETWRYQNDLIRANFAKIEHEPIPLSLSLAPARPRRLDTLPPLNPTAAFGAGSDEDLSAPALKTGDLAKLCTAIGVAFASGMIAALVTPHITRPLSELFPNRPPSIARAAAELPLPSQTLEIAELREKGSFADPREKSPDAAAKSSSSDYKPASALVRDLTALDLSVNGFQIGIAPTDPALCLFVSTRAAEPLTLCLGKDDVSSRPGFRTTEAPRLRSVDWTEKTGHFALAGHLSEMAMLDLAQRIHARVEARDQTP